MNTNQGFIEPEVLEQGLKRVLIKFSAGLKPPQQALIGPGTTTYDLLRHMRLSNDYVFSTGPGIPAFGMNEVLYPIVNDGDLLFATSLTDSGN